MKLRECPKCGEPMEFEEDDNSVGIVGGWYCTNCDHTELADDLDDESDLQEC